METTTQEPKYLELLNAISNGESAAGVYWKRHAARGAPSVGSYEGGREADISVLPDVGPECESRPQAITQTGSSGAPLISRRPAPWTVDF